MSNRIQNVVNNPINIQSEKKTWQRPNLANWETDEKLEAAVGGFIADGVFFQS
ncbi:hypothetical protein [Aquirufa aurantiipilula]|uniref:Uncharacterized protein n=1 Tax=Aquirufa aurantiipilula TaxID=2696561 RepID=A0ABT6BKM6_9BACT|nr:hypothetical protein [Aquirufa aurantiipilula]MDF5691012.1 hypothetical protein [Aquirufa aurantiipilula]